MTMRPKSSIFDLREIASGEAIAAFPLARSMIQVAVRTSDRFVLENAAWSQAAMACEA